MSQSSHASSTDLDAALGLCLESLGPLSASAYFLDVALCCDQESCRDDDTSLAGGDDDDVRDCLRRCQWSIFGNTCGGEILLLTCLTDDDLRFYRLFDDTAATHHSVQLRHLW